MNGINIIKVGGAVVENPESLQALLDSFIALDGMKVLVHGGGRSATKMAERLGVPTTMIGGRRVTDTEMLDIVTMVYGGLVNKRIVAKLQSVGVNALGLTGADLNAVRAHRRPLTPEGVDFGWVGDVDEANGTMLLSLLKQGITPVVAPLTHDGQGHLLNTNADTMAATVATAIAKAADTERVTLTYCFELPGVMRDANDESTVIKQNDESIFHQLVNDRVVQGGMIPKLENALQSIRAGVSRVVITRYDQLSSGTEIV